MSNPLSTGLTPGLGADPAPIGVIRQTETSSCAPAAAATLLRAHRIDLAATEAELAQLCFTDPILGTSDLGLFRGLRLKAPGRIVRFHRRELTELRQTNLPALVFVGLEPERVGDPELFAFLRDRCNWREGEVHAVVCFGFARDAAPGGASYEVALVGDPSFGLERWALEHFAALWDGTSLELE